MPIAAPEFAGVFEMHTWHENLSGLDSSASLKTRCIILRKTPEDLNTNTENMLYGCPIKAVEGLPFVYTALVFEVVHHFLHELKCDVITL
jgi:hypothetical protein